MVPYAALKQVLQNKGVCVCGGGHFRQGGPERPAQEGDREETGRLQFLREMKQTG